MSKYIIKMLPPLLMINIRNNIINNKQQHHQQYKKLFPWGCFFNEDDDDGGDDDDDEDETCDMCIHMALVHLSLLNLKSKWIMPLLRQELQLFTFHTRTTTTENCIYFVVYMFVVVFYSLHFLNTLFHSFQLNNWHVWRLKWNAF